MEFVNTMYQHGTTPTALETLLQLLAPFAPFIAEEGWSLLKKEGSIHHSQWPNHHPDQLEENNVTIVLQVNGKVRDKINIEKNSDQKKLETLALNSKRIQHYTINNEIKKIIVIPNKLVNIVVTTSVK